MSARKCHNFRCDEPATHLHDGDPAFAFCDTHWETASVILDQKQCNRLRASAAHVGRKKCKHGHSQAMHGAISLTASGGIYRYCRRCAQLNAEKRHAQRGEEAAS